MKYVAFILVFLYLYSICFGIFLTTLIRIPAPVLFGLPLLLFFKSQQVIFLYWKELLAFFTAIFLYEMVGLSNDKTFIYKMVITGMCIFYFNYFIGTERSRLHLSLLIFFGLLTCSAIILILNPFYPEQINTLRSQLMAEPIVQSPSGIAVYQFNFGYQLAALVSFLFIYTFVFKEHFLLKIIVLLNCLAFIYLGMQRSVFIGFLCSSAIFLWVYYKYKGVLILAGAVFVGLILYNFILKDNFDSYNNILNKNEQSSSEYNRAALTAENLRIYSEHPYGLIFYGKNWSDVIYRNQVFSSGITSHNAYLMFITYLGPFLGLGLLFTLYYKVFRIARDTLKQVRKQENALMVCLCGAFLAVSINALSHNAWLLSANGPTLFLYFAILQLHHLTQKEAELMPVKMNKVA